MDKNKDDALLVAKIEDFFPLSDRDRVINSYGRKIKHEQLLDQILGDDRVRVVRFIEYKRLRESYVKYDEKFKKSLKVGRELELFLSGTEPSEEVLRFTFYTLLETASAKERLSLHLATDDYSLSEKEGELLDVMRKGHSQEISKVQSVYYDFLDRSDVALNEKIQNSFQNRVNETRLVRQRALEELRSFHSQYTDHSKAE
jgi:hypothetical protein